MLLLLLACEPATTDSPGDSAPPEADTATADTATATDTDCDDVTWYVDADGDGWGDSSQPVEACTQPEGTSARGEDCDDSNALVSPAGAEICDGIDNNCDTVIDEGLTDTFYADADGDGFGLTSDAIEDCSQPEGYAPTDGDCDDTDSAVYPDGEQLCNGSDGDCDGEVPQWQWYRDADGDGLGSRWEVAEGCEPPEGYVEDDTDCDDSDADIETANLADLEGWSHTYTEWDPGSEDYPPTQRDDEILMYPEGGTYEGYWACHRLTRGISPSSTAELSLSYTHRDTCASTFSVTVGGSSVLDEGLSGNGSGSGSATLGSGTTSVVIELCAQAGCSEGSDHHVALQDLCLSESGP